MRMGRWVAVVLVMAVVVVSMSWAEAQGPSCLSVAGAGAPFNDAATVVQQLRVRPGQCCHSGSRFCSVVATFGNAAASVCGSFCPSCADVGNNLNQVLAQCNVRGEVQGAYSPDGTSNRLFYLTANSKHP